jgi:hypothetical protein
MLIAVVYLSIGVGFIFGRRWARNMMILLMTLTGIVAMFWAAASNFFGDDRSLWGSLLVLGLACYTFLFEVISGFVRERKT